MGEAGTSGASLDHVYVIGRLLLLLVPAFAGMLSLYLGYRLYLRGIESRTDVDAGAGEGWRIKLSTHGPGAVFIIFGIWLLVTVVNKELQYERAQGEEVNVIDEEPPPVANGGEAAPVGNRGNLSLLMAASFQPAQGRPPPRVRGARRICYISRVALRGLDGDLSSASLRNALSTALPILTAHARSGLAPREAARVNDAIDALSLARESTGEWRIDE